MYWLWLHSLLLFNVMYFNELNIICSISMFCTVNESKVNEFRFLTISLGCFNRSYSAGDIFEHTLNEIYRMLSKYDVINFCDIQHNRA